MKRYSLSRIALVGMAAGALMAMTVPQMKAATGPTGLLGQLALRPLTPTEKTTYGLSSLQGANGLSSVGIGQPAYLEALVNISLKPTNILSVTWALTNKPLNSMAVLASSPLGSNVPPFNVSDRLLLQVAGGADTGRRLLVPDLAGQYTVVVTINTTTYGVTNLVKNISCATYLGVEVCAFCHSGGVQAPNMYVPWSQTAHATMFTRSIDGGNGTYRSSCISCHTVGYDANTNAVNGGFDDVAKQYNWTFPTNITNGNWASMPAALQNLANISCENCHGPGSEHAYAFGNTNLANWPRLGVTLEAGNCAQCHDAMSHHFKNAEWNNSRHAVATRSPSGPGREACARCHTGGGFVQYAATLGTTNTYTTNNADTAYMPINCATCHDPHDATNPHQLRTGSSVLMADGVTVVTDAGLGGICMNCHRSRNGSVTNSIVKYPLGQQTWAGGSAFGVHDNCASDMLEGVNGWTYGKEIPSSAHRHAVKDTCVGCHMQEIESGPAFTKAGGHTMNMSCEVVSTNGVTNTYHMVEACAPCHGEKESFDFAVQDYNGDGIIEGVQTEVQHLLDTLSTLLPGSAYSSNGVYIPDGQVKAIGRNTIKTNWPAAFLKAAYNWQFVNYDLSKGVHNAPYATGLLRASIEDLTGSSAVAGPMATFDMDYYKWQVTYFGAGSNTNAAPNANPAGDKIPNWAKYALGLDPTIKGTQLPDGVVWANGSKLYNSTNSSTIKIYTAAEVAFNTEQGKNYQIQAISAIGGTWQNIGDAIPGTGNTISYVTPTRQNVQQYYRVVTNP